MYSVTTKFAWCIPGAITQVLLQRIKVGKTQPQMNFGRVFMTLKNQVYIRNAEHIQKQCSHFVLEIPFTYQFSISMVFRCLELRMRAYHLGDAIPLEYQFFVSLLTISPQVNPYLKFIDNEVTKHEFFGRKGLTCLSHIPSPMVQPHAAQTWSRPGIQSQMPGAY